MCIEMLAIYCIAALLERFKFSKWKLSSGILVNESKELRGQIEGLVRDRGLIV